MNSEEQRSLMIKFFQEFTRRTRRLEKIESAIELLEDTEVEEEGDSDALNVVINLLRQEKDLLKKKLGG